MPCLVVIDTASWRLSGYHGRKKTDVAFLGVTDESTAEDTRAIVEEFRSSLKEEQ